MVQLDVVFWTEAVLMPSVAIVAYIHSSPCLVRMRRGSGNVMRRPGLFLVMGAQNERCIVFTYLFRWLEVCNICGQKLFTAIRHS